jgi:hypothetical protein
MKNTLTKFGKNLAAFVASLAKSNDHQRQPITLYMIATELESDLMKLRSRFVKVITRVYGTVANWLSTNRR